MKVKICGVRDVKSALVCESFSADFIGLNFVPNVHREIDIASAIEISKQGLPGVQEGNSKIATVAPLISLQSTPSPKISSLTPAV